MFMVLLVSPLSEVCGTRQLEDVINRISDTLDAWDAWQKAPTLDVTMQQTAAAVAADAGTAAVLFDAAAAASEAPQEARQWSRWEANLQYSKLHLVRSAAASLHEFHGDSAAAFNLMRMVAEAAVNGSFWAGRSGHWCRGDPPTPMREVRKCWEDRWCDLPAGINDADRDRKHSIEMATALRLTAAHEGDRAAVCS